MVTQTEAGRWEEKREEHEAQARQLQRSVIDAYRRRGQEPPAFVVQQGQQRQEQRQQQQD